MQYSLVILICIYRMYWLSILESIMIWNFLDNHYLELPFWQLRCTSFVQCFNFHHMKDILKKSLENVMGRKIICYIFSFVRNGQVCCLLTWSKMPSKYFFTNFVFYELALLKNSYLQLTACAEIVFFKCSAMTFPTAKSAFSSHNWNILDSFLFKQVNSGARHTVIPRLSWSLCLRMVRNIVKGRYNWTESIDFPTHFYSFQSKLYFPN